MYNINKYVVEYWDEVNDRVSIDAGIVVGTNFAEIGAVLDAQYGDIIINLEVYPLAKDNIYVLENNDDTNLFTEKVNFTKDKKNG